MNVDHKEKVKRWKIAIQQYDFDVEHISGKDNIEADVLSRLTPLPIVSELNILEQTNTVPTYEKLKPEIFQTIAEVHPGPKGYLGHGGVERTLKLLRTQHKSWRHMRKDVTTYIRNCP